jgi:hypothetical protein
VACVLSHVPLAPSRSATAHAQSSALVMLMCVLLLTAFVFCTCQTKHFTAVRLLERAVSLVVWTIAHVLPGNFVVTRGQRRSVLERARGGVSEALGLI